MPNENLTLRTVYIDPDVDDQLRDEAVTKQVGKADLFRKYLDAGTKAVKRHPDLMKTASPLAETVLVLRTVHIGVNVDHALRVEAFDRRIRKNDLIRLYLHVGTNLLVARRGASMRNAILILFNTLFSIPSLVCAGWALIEDQQYQPVGDGVWGVVGGIFMEPFFMLEASLLYMVARLTMWLFTKQKQHRSDTVVAGLGVLAAAYALSSF